MEKIQLIAILISFAYLFLVCVLIIRKKLREEFALLWLFFSVLLIVFSIWRSAFLHIAQLLGVYDPPNIIFTSAIGLICFYLLHLSIVASKLLKENKQMAQKIGTLEKALNELIQEKNSSL